MAILRFQKLLATPRALRPIQLQDDPPLLNFFYKTIHLPTLCLQSLLAAPRDIRPIQPQGAIKFFPAHGKYPCPTPTPSGTVHRSSERPCIERGSCSAAQRLCAELVVAKHGTRWSSSRGPRNGRMLAMWPIRLVALTMCAVRSLNFRCGLFHPPPS